MSIKGLLGFCECKGCWNRRKFDMDIVAHFQNGKMITKTVRICEQHAIEAVKGVTLKNVTIEENADFSEKSEDQSAQGWRDHISQRFDRIE